MAGRECTHIETAIRRMEIPLGSRRCEECARAGGTWVALRMCTMCGHIGCCDSSPGRHAYAHYLSSGHPIVKTAEIGEDWLWCYRDEVAFSLKQVD